MSAEPKVYRSILGAKEIEEILLSVGNKIDLTAIVTDLETGGAANIIAAETLKTTINDIITKTTGEGLKTAINAAENSNVFTDELKTAIENTALRFIGTKTSITERNNTIDTDDLIGGEVILLLANESEQIVFQYWDNATSAWQDTRRAESRDIEVNVAGGTVLKQYPKANFVCLDVSVIAKTSGGDFHMSTVRCGWKGDDLYLTTYGDLYSEELFTVDLGSPTTDTIELKATTTKDNVNIFVEIVNMY